MKVDNHLLNDLKPLADTDQVGEILDAMEELKFSHLPVVDQDRIYLGVVCEDDLLEVSEESDVLGKHSHLLKSYSVARASNLYEAIKIIGEGNLSLLPVISDEKKYVGYLSANEVVQDLGRDLTFSETGGVIVLKVPVRDYQLTQISQIVESEDARIMGIHMSNSTETDQLNICLKINQVDLSRIIKSFERYNYIIVEVFHQSIFDENVADRYESFMKYINT